MEPKINYQYTYFIHPFIIDENKYKEYLIKMLKNENFKLKTFEKEKDFKMYKYFLPNVRNLLFSSFGFGSRKISKLEKLPLETRAALLCDCPCNIFEYILDKDIQAKVNDGKGIYFSIRRIEIICFKSGICFINMKTTLDELGDFSDVLNFNYKFRDINAQASKLSGFDNIHIQTDNFSNMETFEAFIKNITGHDNEISNININTESFLTYSYICIDQEAWNNSNNFENIEHYFIKFTNNLSADNSMNFEEGSVETFSKWKYAKIGLTKVSVGLFASSCDISNYTVLPDEYEKQYFYTYIFNLYKRIYLKKIENDLKNIKKAKKIRVKFIEFTQKEWIREITEDEIGTRFNNKLHEILELDDLYHDIEYKYKSLYKEYKRKKRTRVISIAIALATLSLILNIYNFVLLNQR